MSAELRIFLAKRWVSRSTEDGVGNFRSEVRVAILDQKSAPYIFIFFNTTLLAYRRSYSAGGGVCSPNRLYFSDREVGKEFGTQEAISSWSSLPK